MATTAVERWFIDTNILIFANLPTHPLQAVAAARLLALATAGAELWVSRQVLREYVAGMTRPRTFTGSTTTAALVADVQRFQRTFRVAEDNAAITAGLLSLMSAVTVIGRQVHDANIVATMLDHSIPNLLTDNTADFARFGTYITVVPLVP
jgi:predicted nucleic acid-binding protein